MTDETSPAPMPAFQPPRQRADGSFFFQTAEGLVIDIAFGPAPAGSLLPPAEDAPAGALRQSVEAPAEEPAPASQAPQRRDDGSFFALGLNGEVIDIVAADPLPTPTPAPVEETGAGDATLSMAPPAQAPSGALAMKGTWRADAMTGSAADDVLTGGAGNDTLSGLDGADTLRGGADDDVLLGGAGDDMLFGGKGDDVLIGGLGADALFGGPGKDAFRFESAAEGGDRIVDFRRGEDRVEISAAGFGGGLVAGGSLAGTDLFVRNADGAATEAFGQFIYDTDDRALLWDADGTGAEAAVLIATFERGAGPSAADIVLV